MTTVTVLDVVNERAIVPVAARLMALSARAGAHVGNKLSLKSRSRAGVSESIWTILAVAGVAAIAALVLIPLVTRVLGLGTTALNRVPAASPW